MQQQSVVGRAVPRKEALSKVTGSAPYVDDLRFPDMLHGITIRSNIPRGRICSIQFEGDLPWNEFTIVTADDIPGKNSVSLIIEDQPYLAPGIVNHSQEPILLLAHADKNLLVKASRHVRIDYEPLPAVFTVDESLAANTRIW